MLSPFSYTDFLTRILKVLAIPIVRLPKRSLALLSDELIYQGHIPALRASLSAFTNALLTASPAIPGLDPTIVIPARRLHFTLGVMSLSSPPSTRADASNSNAAHTLEAAMTLLRELRPRIEALLAGRRASVRLDSMDIMPPERRDAERAHVMWVGPSQTDDGDLFRDVAGMSWH